MALCRLSERRREPVVPRSSIVLDSVTPFNQLEQMVPIHGGHRPSESRVHYSNLLPQSAKRQARSTEPPKRFMSKSLLMLDQRRPDSSATVRSISQLQPSRESNKEPIDLSRYQLSSVVSSRNQQRTEYTYPQSILIGPRILDKPCFCQITMRYRSDPTLPPMSHQSRRDEVAIFQVASNGSTWIVFKGFLQANDSFTFKSQRSIDDRFHLKLEINGCLDTTISACCEHMYRRGGRIDDGDSSFWIENVKQYTSCAKCQESIDVSQSSDDEKMAPASNASSEESEDEEDPSVASKKTEPPEMQHKSPTKPSPPPSSSLSAETKKVPEKPTPPPSTGHETSTLKGSPSLVIGPSVSVSTAQAKPTDNESDLFNYVKDVMQQTLSKPKPSGTIPSRLIGNVENFTILYIDQDEERDLSGLRPTINFIRTMNDPNTLGTLLTTCTDEKLLVVISLNQAKAVLPELQQHKCIQSVYCLSKQTQPPEWINQYGKVIGIYQNIESIRDHLMKTLPHALARVIPMEITSKDSISDLSFTYSQLLKETILCHDDESDLKADMLAFCRIHYAHNQEEIDEFEKSFTDTQSIQWYTRHCFLSKILSRAFRTQEIDLLFKMRYLIQCLHQQIRSIALKEPTTVYTMLDIDEETIVKLHENINGLVSFRSFLPGTFERPISMEHQTKDKQRSLVFAVRLGSDCAAKIEHLRSSDCKIDILINLDTVFRVVSIDEDKNGVHTVNLQSIPHDDSHFQQLTQSVRKEIEAPVVILQLTKLLLKTDQYWEGDYLTESIYQDKSFQSDPTLMASLAAAHNLLGNASVAKKDFQTARYQFFKSLRAFQLFLPFNHSMLSSSYNNTGSMFYQDDQNEHAIKFHQMALECQLKASSPDMDAVATYSANIGAAYIDEKDYTEAVKHLRRSATILEKMLAKDNTKSLISILQRISTCLWHTKKYEEALENYKKTLDLQLQLPNPLPQPLSVTYYNLSTAYGRIGDYDEAVACAEKSVAYLRTISEDHPELKENQAQLEVVRQKQWLKQVLSN